MPDLAHICYRCRCRRLLLRQHPAGEVSAIQTKKPSVHPACNCSPPSDLIFFRIRWRKNATFLSIWKIWGAATPFSLSLSPLPCLFFFSFGFSRTFLNAFINLRSGLNPAWHICYFSPPPPFFPSFNEQEDLLAATLLELNTEELIYVG